MWQPTASIETLKARARIISSIRSFFAGKEILEVDTPLLSMHTVTDPHVHGIPAIFKSGTQEKIFYLQTSPEYAMKRLLASESGSIYQISKAFRQGDMGRFHNPEFTMLEWYRIGFNHHDLMNDVDELLQIILKTPPAQRISYKELFEQYTHLNPHEASIEDLANYAKSHTTFAGHLTEQSDWLDLLFSYCIEPHLGQVSPVFLYDFPIQQAALAKIRQENPPVASRFEVYFKGVELANGFHELEDAKEQRLRFERDLTYRSQHQLASVAIDEKFLAALEAGLPACAGVALGVDRLIMLALGLDSVAEAMSFGG